MKIDRISPQIPPGSSPDPPPLRRIRSLGRTADRKRWRSRWLFALIGVSFQLLGACKGDRAAHWAPAPENRFKSGIQLRNVAEEWGLAYRWPAQKKPMRNLEAFGRGCAFLDYDNDGWMDVLLVDSPQAALFHNLGGRRFENVSGPSGLARVTGTWTGVGVGDVDGDGWLDLVLTGYRRLALLRNRNGERFQDVTAAAGLDPRNRNHWGSSAGLMDLDGNGALDLIILNYVIFGPREKQYCELVEGVKSGCPPSVYRPEFGELWMNLGAGRFKDVTASSGMKQTHGKALVVAFVDSDGDGKMDFYLGNDGTPADFMHNLGGMRFQNIAEQNNTAFGEPPGHALASMGADWADYDRDGRLDLAVSAFSDESYEVFRATAGGLFEHASSLLSLAGPTLKPLGFGTKWVDIDNDGWPDLFYANGHVYDAAEQIDPFTTYRQPIMIFHNEKGRQLDDVVPRLGGELARPIVGRGSATGDFDNDGRVDLLAVDYEGTPLLLHNESSTDNHWITLDLRAGPPNRFAYGARILLRAGRETWLAQVSPASSYLSYSDPRVHLGLGSTKVIDSMEIRWPDGKRETLMRPPVDGIVRVEEGAGLRPAAAR